MSKRKYPIDLIDYIISRVDAAPDKGKCFEDLAKSDHRIRGYTVEAEAVRGIYYRNAKKKRPTKVNVYAGEKYIIVNKRTSVCSVVDNINIADIHCLDDYEFYKAKKVHVQLKTIIEVKE